MSEWWPMLFFLSALIISTLMILVCGVVNIRAERSEGFVPSEQDEAEGHTAPFFLASGASTRAEKAEPSHNGFESALRGYLEREERVVASFVSRPSLRRLYSASARPIATKDLKRHLERELQYAAGFVADPSVESLYRQSDPPAQMQ